MLSVFSHPRFIAPIILLVVLAGLFLALERGTEANIRAMQAAITEDVAGWAKRFEAAAGDTQAEKRILGERFSAVQKAKENRRVLFALVALASLLLLGSLLCNARCYHRKFVQTQRVERDMALFASALESTRTGVIIQDMRAAGQPIVFVNQAFSDLTGYDLAAMGESKLQVLFGWHTDKRQAEVLTEAIQRSEATTFDLLLYKKDGSSIWSEWQINPVKDQKDEPGYYVIFLSDITWLKQTQEALLLAKEHAERASHVKSHFLATMSHEIRTPLNGLMGVLELLRDSPLDEDQSRLLTVAINSGRSLYEIINDILDYSKMEAGKITVVSQSFSLQELMESIIELIRPVAAAKSLALELDINKDVPGRVVSDAGRIRQVVLNLLTNAVKYTDQGSVRLRVANLLAQSGNGQRTALLRFEVIDTGIGISAADQDKLFEEFSRIEHPATRRFNGTGLGLAISRRLVKILDGEIGVESQLGAGSKFWFMLPLKVDETVVSAGDFEPLAVAGSSIVPHGQTSILLVEDNETNKLVASRYLDKAGYSYDVAATGAEAIRCAENRPYDLVLMDISMPDMDGFEVTRALRAMGGWASHVPVIALTAHAMHGDRERCLAAGMNDHLSKPLAYDTLVKTMGVWLNALALRNTENVTKPIESLSLKTIPEADAAVLRRLAEELGVETMRRIISVFLKESCRRVDDLRFALKAENFAGVEQAAHALKSSSANCGLMRFARLMSGLEAAAQNHESERLHTLYAELDSGYQAARESLDKACRLYNES